MPFIASVILLNASAVLLALNLAEGGGSVVLARRLQLRLDISAASSSLSSLCANGSLRQPAVRSDQGAFRCPFATMLALHSKICSVRPSSTLFAGQNAIEWLLPHRPETAPPRSVTAASAPLRGAPCLSLRQSSSFPYRRSSGRRRPHAYTVLTVATRYPFRRCPDGVCNTLTGHRVVVPRASRSCGAGGTGAGAARGGPGEVRREAHPSIPISPRRSTVAPTAAAVDCGTVLARCGRRLVSRSQYRSARSTVAPSCSRH